MYFYGFDRYYLLLVMPAVLFALYAQFKVKGTFNRYRQFTNRRGWTGADVAREILRMNGLYDVVVEPGRGELTDHYDPRSRTVRLSEVVYGSASLAAIGVAAHETGHAIQHKVGYGPLALRSTLVPIANIGSSFGPTMAIVGLLFGSGILANIGILLFAGAVLFYLITLPVEFNASKRALEILDSTGMLTGEELGPARKVLSAAAMTYVASALVAIANLLRLLLLVNNRRDDS